MTRFHLPEIYAASAELAAVLNLPPISQKMTGSDKIVVDDRPARPNCLALEYAERASGHAWLSIVLGSDATFVGPLSRTGTACGRCATSRKAARCRDADHVSLIDRWQAQTPGLLHRGLNVALLGEAIEVARSAHRLDATDQIWMRDHTLGYWSGEDILAVWSCPHHDHERPNAPAPNAGGLIHV